MLLYPHARLSELLKVSVYGGSALSPFSADNRQPGGRSDEASLEFRAEALYPAPCVARFSHSVASVMLVKPSTSHVEAMSSGKMIRGCANLPQALCFAEQNNPEEPSQSAVPQAQAALFSLLPSSFSHVGIVEHRSLLPVSQKRPEAAVHGVVAPQIQSLWFSFFPVNSGHKEASSMQRQAFVLTELHVGAVVSPDEM